MERRVVLPELEISPTTFPHPEAEALLRTVTWGSPAGVRYQVAEPLDWRAMGPHTLYLAREQGVLVGLFVVTHAEDYGMVQLLAVAPDALRRGLGAALADRAFALASQADVPWMGTVEATNQRSLALARQYGEHQAELEVLTVTRRRARTSARCGPTEAAVWARGVASAGRIGESRFDAAHASVLNDGGRAVAGVLLVPHHWRLVALPGAQRLLLPLLPLLLGTRAEDYRFGMFHSWWGPVELYDELWTHALASAGLTSGLATGDLRSPLFQQVRRTVPRGIVGRLAGTQRMIIPCSRPVPGPLTFTPVHAL